MAQTDRDFELIVQDGGSRDGSVEFLHSIRHLPSISIVSEPDAGIGQACNRALRRARGAIVGTLCSDDMFEPHALAEVVRIFEQHPECAVVFGSVRMTDATGHLRRRHEAHTFDVVRFMQHEWGTTPPTAATFFSRAACADELWFDESMTTCSDYDLLLRLGHLPFVRVRACLARVRISGFSQTCRPEMYEQFCRDKLASLDRYLSRYGCNRLMEELRKQATAGIYAWAAASMLWIPGGQSYFELWYRRAVSIAPDSRHLESMLNLVHELHEWRGGWWWTLPIRIRIFLRRLGRRLQYV